MSVYQATASAPVNMACIKYWGKRDTALILPTNSSLSVTLDQDNLCATTTSRADPAFAKDTLWLNGKEEVIKPGGRTAVCIDELRRLRQLAEDKNPNEPKISAYKLHIASYNNFPTAAGLASSAAGFAALVSSIARLYSLDKVLSPSQLSLIARQGSGSACRSLMGGFVAWEMGAKVDGSDSLAVQVAPREHWPEMHALICVVSDAKKGTSSTSGMQRTVETSPLLQHRIAHVVPQRMAEIQKAILARDFAAFASLTMRDSNSFHAVCLDTDPPIFYMNDVSRALVALVVEYNRAAGETRAAYTYDAGPNCVIYVLERHVREVANLVARFFPLGEPFKDPYGVFAGQTLGALPLPAGFNEGVVAAFPKGSVKGLIHTRVGDGPRSYTKESDHLLDAQGQPKPLP